jgi:hypothetical protein
VITLFRRSARRIARLPLTPHEHGYSSCSSKATTTDCRSGAARLGQHRQLPRRSIYDKLQVHSRSEAVAKALRNRLV